MGMGYQPHEDWGVFACFVTLTVSFFLLYHNPASFLSLTPRPPPLTAEGLLELLGELLDHAVALHIVHVVIQGITGHLPQGAHVHAPHTDGENLDAGIPRSLGHVLNVVLRTPVCDNDGNL